MVYQAFVFGRPGGAPILGSPYGHVGFGFQIDATTYCVGSVEVVNGQTRHDLMNYWTALTDDPQRFMCTQNPYGPLTRYDMCKSLPVEPYDVSAAQAKMKEISGIDYNGVTQNCLTDTREILKAFGVKVLAGSARPTAFFASLPAVAHSLLRPWPTYALDVSIYTEPDQYGLRDDIFLSDDGAIADPQCDERSDGFQDAPQPVLSCVAVRRGTLALYPEQNYQGDAYVVSAGEVRNSRALPWPEKKIRSYYASSVPFVPADVAALNPDPRFNNPVERADHQNRLALPPFLGPHDRAVLARANAGGVA